MSATIYTVAGRKGGCGKTTTATNFAAWLVVQGHKVALLDTDPEIQAKVFALERAKNPALKALHYEHVTGDIKRTIISLAQEFDYVVIDTPGLDSIEGKRAIAVSHVTLFPFKLSTLDMATLPRANEFVAEVQAVRDDMVAFCFASEMPPGPGGINRRLEAVEALAPLENLRILESFTVARSAYRDSLASGMGVVEWSDKKAAGEFDKLAQEISNAFDKHLEEVTSHE